VKKRNPITGEPSPCVKKVFKDLALCKIVATFAVHIILTLND